MAEAMRVGARSRPLWPAMLAVALGLLAAPTLAQNAAQIAKVQKGGGCPHCDLYQADLQNRVLKSRSLVGARLREADMSLSVLNHSNMAHADLRDVNGYGALFIGVNFTGANLTNSAFVGASLEGANLRRANLRGVNFSGAQLARALGLTQAQLRLACGDTATTLPKRLRLPACK